MKKKWINLLLFSLITFYATAQTDGYKFYSLLDSVKTPGFYNIELTPGLNAHLKTDYSDLRIINDAGKWIPHILHVPAKERNVDAVIYDLKFTRRENSKVNTTLDIENGQNIISNIGLVIGNTAAERFCSLSGSYDQKNWFVINDSILINPVPAEKATENIFSINFPNANYKFFKIVIGNKNKDPFDIKGVVQHSGAFSLAYPKFKLIENPATLVQQKDSAKISYIKITQKQPFHFDNISLQISGVKYFYRNAGLYIPYSEDHSLSNPGQLLQSFTISNNSTLQFQVPLTKASVFYILINNEDNLPVTVKEVNTGFSERFITAYLENRVNYRLIMDNASAVLPDYDLTKLNTKINDSIPFLLFGKIIPTKENILAITPPENNKWILWVSIAAALIILLFFTTKMLREVDKRKKA
jgi:hypothetical protein